MNPPLTLRRRWLQAAGSFPVLAVGVALLLRAELGAAPFDVINTGVAEALGMPLFVGFLVVASTCIVVGRALGGPLGPMTFVVFAVLGVLINAVHSLTPAVEPLAVRIPMFAAGILLAVVGVALQVTAELGPGPGEVLMLGLVEQRLSVRVARWIVDGAVLVVGIVLGGAWGVGTAVILVAFAPLLAAALRMLGFVPRRPEPVELALACAAGQ